MDGFEFQFILKKAPTTPDEAKQLSLEMTASDDTNGWQIVSAVPVSGTPNVLLTFQKPRA